MLFFCLIYLLLTTAAFTNDILKNNRNLTVEFQNNLYRNWFSNQNILSNNFNNSDNLFISQQNSIIFNQFQEKPWLK